MKNLIVPKGRQTVLLLIAMLLVWFHSQAQKRWNGPSAGNWEDAMNWQPRGVPSMTDNVVLDNKYQQDDYKLTLPAVTVNIQSLSLEPVAGAHIELNIPVTNTSSPALVINDNGNSLNIHQGGIISNSSGLASGQSIQAAGIITIYNGGRYIHNSRSSHATEIVARLSGAAGTEEGVFEFDVPGGSYPISINNRTYGTLLLSSTASGGIQTYNASGSSPVIIHGDLQINEGVQLNLDLTNDLVVHGEYIQKGGVFNLASQPNNNTIKIKGDITQNAAATITETSGGLPALELCGDQKQYISFAGTLLNSVALTINNPHGIALMHSLALPYKLQFITGVIKTTNTNLLTLLDNCLAGGGSENGFIDGPVRKTGDDDFEFPVGKQGNYAPVKISGSGGRPTDEFVAEYFLGNPAEAYGQLFEDPPLVRISKLEYWVLERLSGSSPKKLGVHVGNYSTATDLRSLMVVRWDPPAKIWRNEGNSYYAGIATGTLVSDPVNHFGTFTLGSAVAMQNPLPVHHDHRSTTTPSLQETLPFQITNSGYLQVTSAKSERLFILITDLQGKQVLQLKPVLLIGPNRIHLGWDHLATGLYVISLYDWKGRSFGVRKILKL